MSPPFLIGTKSWKGTSVSPRRESYERSKQKSIKKSSFNKARELLTETFQGYTVAVDSRQKGVLLLQEHVGSIRNGNTLSWWLHSFTFTCNQVSILSICCKCLTLVQNRSTPGLFLALLRGIFDLFRYKNWISREVNFPRASTLSPLSTLSIIMGLINFPWRKIYHITWRTRATNDARSSADCHINR